MGDRIDAFVTIDGTTTGNVVINGIASYKYRATFRGAGGHTLIHFGYPNANFALGRALAKVSEIKPPEGYRSSFSAGIIQGGVAISSIPTESTIQFDMRCFNMDGLNYLRDKIVEACHEACKEENERWNHPTERVTCTVEHFGGHPLGTQPDDALIIRIVSAADESLGIPVELISSAVTDINIPLSRGIPAVAVGRGGMQQHGHTLNECWDSTDAYLSPQRALLSVLAMAGYGGVTPMMGKTVIYP
jgi:acetylornithine deacetylase/succinyl-diaminopimelate desuccinylase-like protein